MDYEHMIFAGLHKALRGKASLTPELTWEIIDSINRELQLLPDGHEVRGLRWKVKNLGKELGRASRKIYELRCQLAEARSLITVTPGSHRSTLDRMRAAEKRVAELHEEIRQLQVSQGLASIGGLA